MPIFVNDGKTPLQAGVTDVVPTPDNWGTNTELLAADKTLTDASATVQYLDPGGAQRTIILPPVSIANPFFLLVNRGTANVDSLFVEDSTGMVVGSIGAGKARQFVTDGTTWLSEESSAVSATAGARSLFQFSGTGTTLGHGTGNEARVDVLPCTVTHLGFTRETAVSEIFEVFKNDAATGATLATGTDTEGFGLLSSSVSFASGDDIQVRSDTNPAANRIVTLVAETGLACARFSGSLNDDEFAFVGGSNTFAQNLGALVPEESEILIPFPCTLYAMTGRVTTTGNNLSIFVNGSSDQTVGPTTGRFEFALAPTQLAAGDTVAIRPVAGGSSNTDIYLYLKIDATIYQFGGDLDAANEYAAPFASLNNATDTSLDATDKQIIGRAGRLRFISWVTGSGAGDIEIYVGDTLVYTVQTPSAEGFVDLDASAVDGVDVNAGQNLYLRFTGNVSGGTALVWVTSS